ncbi:MAG: ABC transporter permease [Bacteroidetes bacterium]|nr:ABC transporter permease [Bacteroidota bacterium]
MLNNTIKITLRNLLKYKIYSVINIAGFAIGLASCMLILLYVNYELSYDSFYEEGDNIYRVSVKGAIGENAINQAVTPPPMAHAMVDEYPEVINAVRVMPTKDMLIRPADNIFIENNFLWADSTFFEVFTYKLLLGDRATVLSEHHTVVLTEKTALKYFGRIDVLGEIIEFEDFTPYKVSGVCENPPANTHLKFDILASLSSLEWHNADEWLWNAFHTYLLLKDGADPVALQQKFRALIEKNVGSRLQSITGQTMEEFYGGGGSYDYELMNIGDIHLHSKLDFEIESNSDISYVYIFSLIALFILVIASINFMNLSTARSATRGREVGVRKVLGSNKTGLIIQFITESVILTFISMLLAILFVWMLLPGFNSLAGREFDLQIFSNFTSIFLIIITALAVGVLAGLYPALYLSSFNPVVVLKTSLTSVGKGSKLRKGLVVFQFGISILLIISTLIIDGQLSYMQNTNLGWDRDHILAIKRAWAIENNEGAIRNEMLQNSNILTFSTSGNIPGREFGASVFNRKGAPRSEQHLLSVMTSKADLQKTFNIKVIEGRFFSEEFTDDTNSVILNQCAVRELGLTDPVGDQVRMPGDNPEHDRFVDVIGVVEDFHFESMHHKIRPLLIFKHPDWPAYITMKIRPDNIRETVAHVEEVWKKFIPDKPIEYFFMDDDFARLYESEMRTSKIFSSFSLLAIFIACMGLFGLATFTTIQRRKEIGIRKSMGAGTPGIVLLLSKEFSLLVLLANIIAWPAAYYLMRLWLNNFEYRIDINLIYFLAAGAAALLIAILTICYQAIRAALANPVKSLRYE